MTEPKEQILASITQSIVSMGVDELDVPSIILCRFGIALSSMEPDKLFEVKDWVEQRLAASPGLPHLPLP